MYRKCVTELSAQHQRAVTASLLELMQKQAFEKITVTELCRTANISRRIFYHLFTSKTDALYALIDHAILDLEGFLPDVKDDATRFFLYWKGQKALFDALRMNNLSNLLLERMVIIVLDEDYDIRYRLKDYDRNTGTDSIVFNLCGIMGLTYSWYNTGYQRTPEEMARQLNLLVQQPRIPGTF